MFESISTIRGGRHNGSSKARPRTNRGGVSGTLPSGVLSRLFAFPNSVNRLDRDFSTNAAGYDTGNGSGSGSGNGKGIDPRNVRIKRTRDNRWDGAFVYV